jgi:hypothetical protein
MHPSDLSVPSVDVEKQLEDEFIAQYLRSRDCDAARLRELPEEQRHRLMQDASAYASAKLVEVERTRHVGADADRNA